MNLNHNLYVETEQAEIDGGIDDTLKDGYIRWYGYGTYDGKDCRCEYVTSPADERLANESGDWSGIDWDARIIEIMIADVDGNYDTDDCVVIDNADYEAGGE